MARKPQQSAQTQSPTPTAPAAAPPRPSAANQMPPNVLPLTITLTTEPINLFAVFAAKGAEIQREIIARDAAAFAAAAAAKPIDHAPAAPPRLPNAGGLEIVAGAFVYAGQKHDLTGRPWDMLDALLRSRFGQMGRDELRAAMELQADLDTAVKDAATALRKALKAAIAMAGKKCENPLGSKGKGRHTVYRLDMPS